MRQTVLLLLISLLFLAGCAQVRTNDSLWSLTTWVKSPGGAIVSPNLDESQTSRHGSITRRYFTGQIPSVTVAPDAGYFIASLIMNGKVLTLEDPAAPYTTTFVGPGPDSVLVTFLKAPSALSATTGANGTVNPSRAHARKGLQNPARGFIFVPVDGYAVSEIKVSDHDLNKDYQLLDAVTGRPVTLPAPANARVKLSMFNVKGSATITGSFAVRGAYAGPPRTVLTGSTVTLDGSASTGVTSCSWRQVGGPATVTLSGAATPRATFIAPSKTGIYRFKLDINGGADSSTAIVFVALSYVAAARNQCQNCHEPQKVGSASRVFARWSSGFHAHAAVMCYRCHVGTVTGGHPGLAPSPPGRVCINCHTLENHPFDVGAKACTYCHNPHSASTSPGE